MSLLTYQNLGDFHKCDLACLLHHSFMLPRLVSDGEILTFDVIKTKPEDIKDTNGAGDAFVGGENGGIVLFNLGWLLFKLSVEETCFTEDHNFGIGIQLTYTCPV